MRYRVTCETVGELRKAIMQWPDEKPLLLDCDGNTFPVEIYEWADKEPEDLGWPAAIDGNTDYLTYCKEKGEKSWDRTGKWWNSLDEEGKLKVLADYKINPDYADKSWEQLTQPDRDFFIILFFNRE